MTSGVCIFPTLASACGSSVRSKCMIGGGGPWAERACSSRCAAPDGGSRWVFCEGVPWCGRASVIGCGSFAAMELAFQPATGSNGTREIRGSVAARASYMMASALTLPAVGPLFHSEHVSAKRSAKRCSGRKGSQKESRVCTRCACTRSICSSSWALTEGVQVPSKQKMVVYTPSSSKYT